MSDKALHLRRLNASIATATSLRLRLREDAAARARRKLLRHWQGERLQRTHADLLADPRYGKAARFFVDDLYSAEDAGERDAAVARAVPSLSKMLPPSGVETVADAIELDALSESLDAAMAAALPEGAALDARAYAQAYRAVGRPEDRARQIALIENLGGSLDHLTRLPLIGATLKMMRKPARLLGLGELQAFLERGYDAFRAMGRSEEFVARVAARERALMRAWFAGESPEA
jgi:hypothetical protein